jgi:MoxR-like ATPase
MEGTYPLPEAQIDRFFFKLLVEFPSRSELGRIADLTTASSAPPLKKILDGEGILQLRQWVRDVPIADAVKDYAVRLVLATHPRSERPLPLAEKYVLYGSSPRGLQSLILAAKARSLLSGRPNVSFEDIRAGVTHSLRHRIITKLEADAEGVTVERVLADVVEKVPETL